MVQLFTFLEMEETSSYSEIDYWYRKKLERNRIVWEERRKGVERKRESEKARKIENKE
jgi:hypothetical protein